MVMTIVMVAPDASEVDQARTVRALHVPNADGFCACCLEDHARLAWSPCPQSAWAIKVLAAEGVAVTTARAVVAAPVLPGPAEAQRLIEAHLRSDLSGRCASCRQQAPCHARNLAHAAFLVAGMLPVRRRNRPQPGGDVVRRFRWCVMAVGASGWLDRGWVSRAELRTARDTNGEHRHDRRTGTVSA